MAQFLQLGFLLRSEPLLDADRADRALEPVPRPVLAIPRIFEQLIYEVREGVRRGSLDKALDLLRGWGKSDEIEIRPTHGCQLVRGRRGLQSFIPKLRQDECVERAPRQFLVAFG